MHQKLLSVIKNHKKWFLTSRCSIVQKYLKCGNNERNQNQRQLSKSILHILYSIKVTVSKIPGTSIGGDGKSHAIKGLKPGNCVFPFKHGNKLIKEEDGCIKRKDGKICATSIDQKTKQKKTWAYCPPDSKTAN